MKRRWFALLCSLLLLLSMMPGNRKVEAIETSVKCLNTPEAVAEVFGKEAKKAHTKSKKDSVSTQEAIRRRVIVKSEQKLPDTYGARKVYYYAFGKYQILFYDTADQAERACDYLKKENPDMTIFQDIPVSLKEEDTKSDEEPKAFDGIHMMGMDTLKEDAKDWNGSATVAVIDSGIDTDHPWFATRLDRKNSVNLAADVEDSSAYNDPNQGHGTHVAGIITQATPEQVKIMAIRVFDLTGSASYTTITLGVDYAVEHKADVINMSLGFEIASGFESSDTQLMDEAFARALKAGSTVVAASGNEFTDTSKSYPASSRWTIAVGSLEPSADGTSYIRSDFSNNGTLLDFAAPGRNIYSAWIGEGEQTEIASGTSMATPHLAAAAAYVKLKHPDYNQREVYAEFRDYAVDLGEPGKDNEFGYGYVDLKNYAKQEADAGKKYQAITCDAQINKTMNDAAAPFVLDASLTRGDGALSYTSSNEKIAVADGNKIIIKGVGTCDIIVTAAETAQYQQTSQAVKIRVAKGQQTILVPEYEYKKKLSDKNFWVKASVEAPGDGKLVFLTNENKVLKVQEDGYVTILGTGTTKIYAVAKATDRFVRQVSDAITVTVEKDSEEDKDKENNTTGNTQTNVPANASSTTQSTGQTVTESKPDTPAVSTKTEPTTETENKQTSSKSKTGLKKTRIQKLSSGKKQIRISWEKQKKASAYEIRYSGRKSMKPATVLRVNGTKKIIKRLQANKTYYVQVGAIQKNGKKTVYGAWSNKRKIKVK